MALDIFAAFATDETKELEGVWIELSDGAEILVARAGNKKYNKLLAQQYEKNKRLLDLKNDAAETLSNTIMIDVMARTLLLGWKNIVFKGEDLPHSVDNAKLLLSVKDFRDLVSKHAGDAEAFRLAQLDEAAKN
ncbi:hypothetical protein [Cupriavidus basilensis]|uniref:hypothetical protein n=1 Tax=Cupriavidus basilensis TaxID=68895 RepID=UPI0020A62FC2|nr:hypothetical protein [Cupriavidus basilensis]MCP3023263.1 hypothetical protein [Cupriavidus basilensis]